jgi:phospholipid/cholesterol/gamma-HCH transport system substrate-binding protein
MRHHKLNYVIAGMFVIAMLSVAFGSIFVLSGQNRESDPYHMVMGNVADVKFGTQVRYEGYPIGQVERIIPFGDGGRMKFRIEITVDKGWRLPEDSVGRIGSSSLLAAKTIDVTAGKSAAVLRPGTEIPSAPTTDMFRAMANLAEQVGDLSSESIAPLVDDLGIMARRLGGKLETDLTALTASLNSIAKAVDGRSTVILDRVQSLTERLDASAGNLQQIMSDDNTATVGEIVRNVGETTDNFAALSRDLDGAAGRINALVVEFETIVNSNRGNIDKTLTNAQYSLQTIARNIDSIMLNVDAASRNMSEFTRLIRQNPSLLLGGPPRAQIAPASERRQGIRQ